MSYRLVAVVASLFIAALPVRAQDYPTKPVRVVVPYGAGGPVDREARSIASLLEKELKQQFIVENRVGSGGLLGTEVVAKAPADGYTLLYNGPAMSTINVMFKNPGFDAVKDFEPISIISKFATVLVTTKHVPAKNLQEFVAYAKANPGKLNYASNGRGSVMLTMEALKKEANINLTEIQYTGQSQIMPDLLAGRVQATVIALDGVMQHVKSGDITLLANLSDKRYPHVPDLPTTKELGYKTVIASTWSGLLAPAGTPKAIVDKLAAICAKYPTSADVKKRMETSIYLPVGSTPKEFRDAITGDYRIWQSVADGVGLKPE